MNLPNSPTTLRVLLISCLWCARPTVGCWRPALFRRCDFYRLL